MTTKTRAVFWQKDDPVEQEKAAEALAAGVAGGAILTELNAKEMRERVAKLVEAIGADAQFLPNDGPQARQENAKLCAREVLCLYAACTLVGTDALQMLEMVGLEWDAVDNIMEKLKLHDSAGDSAAFPLTAPIKRMRAATVGPRHNQ